MKPKPGVRPRSARGWSKRLFAEVASGHRHPVHVTVMRPKYKCWSPGRAEDRSALLQFIEQFMGSVGERRELPVLTLSLSIHQHSDARRHINFAHTHSHTPHLEDGTPAVGSKS